MSDKWELIGQLVKALDLEELTAGYRRRLQILDSQIQAFRELEQAYRQKLVHMDRAIDHLRALYKTNMRLINLIYAPQKKEPGDEAGTDKTVEKNPHVH